MGQHPICDGSSEKLYKIEDFIGRRRQGKEFILAKSGLFQAMSPEGTGGRQGSTKQITSLVLTE